MARCTYCTLYTCTCTYAESNPASSIIIYYYYYMSDCFSLQRILLQNGGKLHVKDIGDGIVASGLIPSR